MGIIQEVKKMVWKKPFEVLKDTVSVLLLSGSVILVYWGMFMLLKDII